MARSEGTSGPGPHAPDPADIWRGGWTQLPFTLGFGLRSVSRVIHAPCAPVKKDPKNDRASLRTLSLASLIDSLGGRGKQTSGLSNKPQGPELTTDRPPQHHRLLEVGGAPALEPAMQV